jgi:hypothetical protein
VYITTAARHYHQNSKQVQNEAPTTLHLLVYRILAAPAPTAFRLSAILLGSKEYLAIKDGVAALSSTPGSTIVTGVRFDFFPSFPKLTESPTKTLSLLDPQSGTGRHALERDYSRVPYAHADERFLDFCFGGIPKVLPPSLSPPLRLLLMCFFSGLQWRLPAGG